MINEIHKGCGGYILHTSLASNPPIPCKQCQKCGMKEMGEREKVETIEVELNKNSNVQ